MEQSFEGAAAPLATARERCSGGSCSTSRDCPREMLGRELQHLSRLPERDAREGAAAPLATARERCSGGSCSTSRDCPREMLGRELQHLSRLPERDAREGAAAPLATALSVPNTCSMCTTVSMPPKASSTFTTDTFKLK